jgi:hypothetical protein
MPEEEKMRIDLIDGWQNKKMNMGQARDVGNRIQSHLLSSRLGYSVASSGSISPDPLVAPECRASTADESGVRSMRDGSL